MNEPSIDPAAQLEQPRRPLLRLVLERLGPFLALVLLWLGFGIAYWACNHGPDAMNPWAFFSYRNSCLIFSQSAIVTIAACGMTLIIVSGGIDLSAGSAIALCSVVAAVVMERGGGPALAMLAAVGCGMLAGSVNGSVIAGTRMMPFIVTLGMLGIARGIAKGLANNETVNYAEPVGSWFSVLMRPYPLDADPGFLHNLVAHPLQVVAPGVWVAVAAVAVVATVMGRTVFGRHVYAIGSNEAAARLCGIRVPLVKVMVYTLAGAFIGLAATLETAKLHQGDPTTAGGRELDIIAAVVIGGASLAGGTGTVVGAVVGAVIMGVLRNGSQQLGWPTYMQEIIIGAVIVVAVGIDRLRLRGSGRSNP